MYVFAFTFTSRLKFPANKWDKTDLVVADLLSIKLQLFSNFIGICP